MTENKLAKINFYGGLIGLFFSEKAIINKELTKWNSNGYKAVQITSSPVSYFFVILSLLLLFATMFLFTFTNGVWILMEKEK